MRKRIKSSVLTTTINNKVELLRNYLITPLLHYNIGPLPLLNHQRLILIIVAIHYYKISTVGFAACLVEKKIVLSIARVLLGLIRGVDSTHCLCHYHLFNYHISHQGCKHGDSLQNRHNLCFIEVKHCLLFLG